VARKFSIASGLLALMILAVCLWTAPASMAQSSQNHLLRCKIVKRTSHYVVVRHRDPVLHARIPKSQHVTWIHGQKFRVTNRTRRYVVLRAVRPNRPHKPAQPPIVTTDPTPTPTPTVTPTPTPTPTVTPTPTTTVTPTPTATPTVTPTPTPTPTVTPTTTPTPTPTPTVTPAPSGGLILTAADVSLLRQRIAAGTQPYASAWTFFRDGKVKSAMSATPSVDVGPTNTFSYTKLDTDSRLARNVAVAYACTGTSTYAAKASQFVVAWAQANHPAPYSFTGDYQGGYHQAYGAFSFALAYDLTRDSGAYSAADQATVQTWFRTWGTVMKGYQDNFSKDFWFSHTGRGTYHWPNSTLTFDQTDFYTGRDTAAAPASAWLACAIVSGDTGSLSTLYSPTYKLSVPAILHAATAPDNDGDGTGTGAVPQVQVQAAGYYDNSSRGGCLDYMSYNTRMASMLYEMTANQGRATAAMGSALHASWSYLSKFSGPGYASSPAPNDVIHWDLHLSRIQSAVHIYGDQQFQDDVNGGQFPRAQFYESQFLGPTTLTQS
jgi:hypothetical protein